MNKLLLGLMLAAGVDVCLAQSITVPDQLLALCKADIGITTKAQMISCLNQPNRWTDKVRIKIKSNLVFNPEAVVGNPAAVIEVDLDSDGKILNIKLVNSSGNHNWDNAVQVALYRAQSLPKDDNGVIPMRQLKLSFSPKDGPSNTDIARLKAMAGAEGGAGPVQTDIGKLVVLYQPDADPYYPSFSKRVGEQGAVVVRLIINESGEVYEVDLLKASPFQRLDRAAIEIGKRYKFEPFLVNGAPVKISTNLLIKFNLK